MKLKKASLHCGKRKVFISACSISHQFTSYACMPLFMSSIIIKKLLYWKQYKKKEFLIEKKIVSKFKHRRRHTLVSTAEHYLTSTDWFGIVEHMRKSLLSLTTIEMKSQKSLNLAPQNTHTHGRRVYTTTRRESGGRRKCVAEKERERHCNYLSAAV